jgi:CheY-like chemotaxis protein
MNLPPLRFLRLPAAFRFSRISSISGPLVRWPRLRHPTRTQTCNDVLQSLGDQLSLFVAAIELGRLLSTHEIAKHQACHGSAMRVAVVLLVEENAALRTMMGAALQAHGYAVVEAEDGASALRLATERAPALVLLDCNLPDMDGFEVARRLRSVAPSVPVIGIAGWAQANEARVLTAGFLDVLVKPVDTSRLVESVQRHVVQTAPRSNYPGRMVLLVDDDPVQRRLAELALSNAGFVVTLADGAKAALRLAAEHKPDAIVSDVLMPEMDGLSFCKVIRRDPSLAGVPIVLTSAHNLEDEDRALGLRFGASRYVSRSHGLDVVVRAVLEAMDTPVAELSVLPTDDLQPDYLRRIAHQLERQASTAVGLAHRVSLQATAQSVLDGLSDSLAREHDPESRLVNTLATCLDAAGLSVGTILLLGQDGQLVPEAQAGSKVAVDWATHAAIVLASLDRGGLTLPSPDAGLAGDELLVALGAASALVVPISAREQVLGALVLAS